MKSEAVPNVSIRISSVDPLPSIGRIREARRYIGGIREFRLRCHNHSSLHQS